MDEKRTPPLYESVIYLIHTGALIFAGFNFYFIVASDPSLLYIELIGNTFITISSILAFFKFTHQIQLGDV